MILRSNTSAALWALVLVSHFHHTLAGPGWSRDLCLSACELWSTQVPFADVPEDTPYLAKRCAGTLAPTSLFLCATLWCPEVDLVEGFRELNETCHTFGSALPSLDLIAGYTDEELAKIRRILPADHPPTEPVKELVLPSGPLFRNALDTLNAVTYVHARHIGFGLIVFAFWIVAIIIGVFFRISHMFHPTVSEKQALASHEYDEDSAPLTTEARPRGRDYPKLWLKRFITVPATFGYRCLQNVGWCTIPPRVESLIILLFIIINTVFCVIGYPIFDGNLYFPTIYKQTCRYIADRTGYLSVANFPLIWLFGMRNNLLMGMTGWHFGTFNNFHRWIARVSTLQAVIHSIAYTVLVVDDGGWPLFKWYWTEYFWWAGEVATIAMCAILGFSVFWMRRQMYEIFLLLHIVLSIIVLITMFGHVSIFNGQFDPPMWICVVIWLCDRLLRLSRVFAFNPRFWDSFGKITYHAQSNTVRLVIPCSTSIYKPAPGTFYYIYAINDKRPWESHPFTMAYTTPGYESSQMERVGLLQQQLRPQYDVIDEDIEPSMTFLIRPYDSFTSRIRDRAAAGKTKARVLIEGPYGTTHAFEKFEHILFIVGGSGIVVPLSYLEVLNRSLTVKSVRIVWSVREPGFAEEVLKHDIPATILNGKVNIEIFLTRGFSSHTSPPEWPKNVNIVPGRPDVYSTIEYAAYSSDGESLAIISCGPAKMADDSRRAAVTMLGRGFHRVEYFQEAFNW
ncbi:hypothetical protein jhhlp_002779 [Lomentospora prolificans]|uniref:FAD-binding FR-type domain-containing protein n=1 Tax=Lomentospora prolificans TaxID=41688 RepID=A0A2N3NEZ8_9PEZI|nr:hypothetical protein jhhlp_002779 [Lomentospora prolificans]